LLACLSVCGVLLQGLEWEEVVGEGSEELVDLGGEDVDKEFVHGDDDFLVEGLVLGPQFVSLGLLQKLHQSHLRLKHQLVYLSNTRRRPRLLNCKRQENASAHNETQHNNSTNKKSSKQDSSVRDHDKASRVMEWCGEEEGGENCVVVVVVVRTEVYDVIVAFGAGGRRSGEEHREGVGEDAVGVILGFDQQRKRFREFEGSEFLEGGHLVEGTQDLPVVAATRTRRTRKGYPILNKPCSN